MVSHFVGHSGPALYLSRDPSIQAPYAGEPEQPRRARLMLSVNTERPTERADGNRTAPSIPTERHYILAAETLFFVHVPPGILGILRRPPH